MPRRLRIASGGIAYHVLNRAAGRQDLFPKEADYAAFIQVLEQTHQRLRSGWGWNPTLRPRGRPRVRLIKDSRPPNPFELSRYCKA